MPTSSSLSGVSWHRITIATLLALCASVPSAGFGQAAKLKKPPQATITKEVATVRRTYEKQLLEAAKDNDKATKLVQEIVSKVEATPDAEGKWALLQVAQEVAIRDSDSIDTAMKCVDMRGALFESDVVEDQIAVLREFSKPKPPASRDLFEKAVLTAKAALAADQYEEAANAAEIAACVAAALEKDEQEQARKILKESKGKVKPPPGVADANYITPGAKLRKRVVEARLLFEEHAKASMILKTSPNDKAAQGSVGSYQCFIKADWASGLPLLAGGGEATTADIANAELAASNPADTVKLLAVADRWWDLSEGALKESEVKSDAIKRHAAEVYKGVLHALRRPVDVDRAKTRIAEVGVRVEQQQQQQKAGLAKVFLSDLQETESKVVHFGFGKGTINGKDNPIRSIINGELSPHGLSMHPGDGPNDQCFVKYRLPKGARRLSAIATIDKSGSFDNCGIGFEVFADGKSIWKSRTINKEHQSELCEVDVPDCRSLELRTYEVTAAFGGHAVWIEPRLHVDSTVWPMERPDFPANREAAEWVVRIKGKVEVDTGKKRETINDLSKLPVEHFVVTGIDLVANQNVNDNETARLSKLTSLEGLGLGGTAITDITMGHISQLPKLKGLSVNWTKVTGKGIEQLTSASLESIDCSGAQDMHRGMQRLHAMGSVRVLVFGLTDMQKNPGTLKLVSEMKTLRHLQFGKDDMSAAQIQTLQQALPQCVMVK